MSRVWFAADLETAATFWRILRRDGVTLGFTSHDRDLWFDGVLHRASPGMVPSAIRRSADFEPDSAEARGAITHEAITSADLAAGRFDGAQVRIGVVDWESGEHEVLYAGTMGAVSEEDGQFTAGLASRKAELERDFVPRTSPSCRAAFCGPGCNLNAPLFTHEMTLAALDEAANSATLEEAPDPAIFAGGTLRWLDGPQAGLTAGIMANDGSGGLVLDVPIDTTAAAGTRVLLREGCDHTLETCATRFGNAVNFRGEPFLPGNDLLTRYPGPVQ
ncbi:DUF2163 domain-containing protein [Novosphingobium album (ex Hu et al. 2023)]|uniref:DUF2163 domain-containing protein n=1 Tax=Novosphingobium album (ex Hu et al. 2023) TaxID=2930093 RepID=A0ABT0B0W6_9SPHN|nr:DUF2163 domain-containing protein [Novosphingobium album (ex Hu et al. 2023)]MCJ2178684.1 DUF2163 domain-containing protein [Novosphingobium album (ex Hu et al. 2023)]